MKSLKCAPWLGLSALALLACGGGSSDAFSPHLDCRGVAPLQLSIGSHAVVDPTAQNGCIRLPAAGSDGAEYVIAAVSAAGQELPQGATGSFTLQAGTDESPVQVPAPSPRLSTSLQSIDLDFHAMLRARERTLSQEQSHPVFALQRHSTTPIPPLLESKRTFKVCQTTACVSFVSVLATAKYVGARGAVFLDDTVPGDGYTQADIDSVGALFDQYLYPIDTTAFGRESDLDDNGVVVILLTDQLNRLTPSCNSTRSTVLGYFFGLDLLSDPNSNVGEVFYGLVPDPFNPNCTISRQFVRRNLAPVFIHEFQHMISFYRHRVLAGGSAEETWLNEGLSHFAEELGGRLVPNEQCVGGSCLTQFVSNDLGHAYEYLFDPTAHYLVEPGISSGTAAERGANWLFVRWLADRSPTDSTRGTDITRLLDGADSPVGVNRLGGANVAEVGSQLFQPGVTFDQLVGEWQLANYLEGHPDFTESTGRLRYQSWNLPHAFDDLVLGPYPLRPDEIEASGYSRTGTLRGGSAVHLRVVQHANGEGVAVDIGTSKTSLVRPRFAVARIR